MYTSIFVDYINILMVRGFVEDPAHEEMNLPWFRNITLLDKMTLLSKLMLLDKLTTADVVMLGA